MTLRLTTPNKHISIFAVRMTFKSDLNKTLTVIFIILQSFKNFYQVIFLRTLEVPHGDYPCNICGKNQDLIVWGDFVITDLLVMIIWSNFYYIHKVSLGI